MIAKACPVALHPDGAPRRLVAFHHPQAGVQIPKGTVRTGEPPDRAAARELFEETGLETIATLPLGQSKDIREGEVWFFTLCRTKPPVRDRWRHYCTDDGGLLLDCFWHPLDDPAGLGPVYQRALCWISEQL